MLSTINKNLVKNQALLVSDIKSDLLLFDPINSTAYVLNQTAKTIWLNLSDEFSFEQNENNTISSAFIQNLEDKGLLKASNNVSAPISNQAFPTQVEMESTPPSLEVYSEEFLKKYLNDESFATFHDDTFSDLGGK